MSANINVLFMIEYSMKKCLKKIYVYIKTNLGQFVSFGNDTRGTS